MPREALFEGTFKWPRDTPFKLLPKRPERTPVLHSWDVYSTMRGVDGIEPSQIDGLSYVLSLLCGLKKLKVHEWDLKGAPLHVVVGGASAKAEQVVLERTNYWEELATILPDVPIMLHLVGPEVDDLDRVAPLTYCAACGRTPDNVAAGSSDALSRCTSCHRAAYCNRECQTTHWKAAHKQRCAKATHPERVLTLSPTLTAVCHRGSIEDYFRKQRFVPASTVFYGCNTGLGSGNAKLMVSWATDVRYLVTNNFLCIMSCANTWSDLRGELQVLETLYNANVVMAPSANPFKAMTTVQDEEKQRSTGLQKWYCGNHCMYAFRGASAQVPDVHTIVKYLRQMAPAMQEYPVVPES